MSKHILIALGAEWAKNRTSLEKVDKQYFAENFEQMRSTVKRNNILFEEVKKKHSRKNSGSNSMRCTFTNKIVIAAKTLIFRLKIFF